ncbi:hypothetical protein CGW93_03810 [candidate division bacterium WOR-3 4484_18]|uniref:TolC family protein n=1 Tax=candidate division WOR-3 bacterium 4484_18 TaxID=2020626 RepID=A0A257LUZ9_UNCW3|nr:MAG: hypothetical protein CGW93_03810 [candidate division bacterium WOR-3 4484_18]
MWYRIAHSRWASISICIISLYSILLLSHPLCADSTSNDTLTLTECIEIALNNSPDLRVARNNLRVAELDLQDMKTAIAPTIQLSGGYNLNNVYNRLEWTPNHYHLGINATITPFSSGKNLISIAKYLTLYVNILTYLSHRLCSNCTRRISPRRSSSLNLPAQGLNLGLHPNPMY